MRSFDQKRLTFILMLVMMFVLMTSAAVDCQRGWIYFRGSCYSPLFPPATKPDADIFCADWKGFLASATHVEELIVVQPLARGLTVWIGVKFYNGNWWNDDGYPLHFSNWAPNNPAGTGPCAIMNGDGHWQDNDCTGPAHFLCKVPHSRNGCYEPPHYIHSIPQFSTALLGATTMISCAPGWITHKNQTGFLITCTLEKVADEFGKWVSDFNGCEVDLNECQLPNVCGSNSGCVNTPGSFYCLCNGGYQWTDGTSFPMPNKPTAEHGYCEEGKSGLCDDPDDIQDGSMSHVRLVKNSEVIFSCVYGSHAFSIDPKYFHYSNYRLSCVGPVAQWKLIIYPECIKRKCSDPGPKPFSLKTATTFYFQSIVRYTCMTGYKRSDGLPGDITIKCQEDETWSKGAECIDIDECAASVNPCESSEVCTNLRGSYLCDDNTIQRNTDTGLIIAISILGVLYIPTAFLLHIVKRQRRSR